MLINIQFIYNRSTPIKLQKISRLSRVDFDENEKTVKLPERVNSNFFNNL